MDVSRFSTGGAEGLIVTQIAVSYWEDEGNARKHELIERLEEDADVDVLDPLTTHEELADGEYDLYHNAKRREGSLHDHALAAEAGIPTVNSPEGGQVTIDRLRTLRHLEQIGVPTPPYQYGSPDAITMDAPLVAKPRIELGEDRHDITFFGSEKRNGLPFENGTLDYVGEQVVEKYIETERHFKVYRLGDTVRGVELRDPLQWDGEEIAPTPAMEQTAHRIGESLDMQVLEADMVRNGETLYTVDVNQTVNGVGLDDVVDDYEQTLWAQLENRYDG